MDMTAAQERHVSAAAAAKNMSFFICLILLFPILYQNQAESVTGWPAVSPRPAARDPAHRT